jgi:hypothetical protein
MIATHEITLAEHEAKQHGKPWLVLKAIGVQPGFGSIPSRTLYNIIAGEYCIGSTVTIESMLAKGYRVEVVA